MHDYKQRFIEFALDRQALKFGSFVLKSGRTSPYFFNTGQFASGAALAELGRHYASAVVASELEFDMIYGPAYKGIPLVSALGAALWTEHQRDVPYAFNRKEAKDHGEGGIVVGAELSGRVLIVDDVISAGTSVRESVDIINGAGARPVGVVIALDRQERGNGACSAVQEIEQSLDLRVLSVLTLGDLMGYLEDSDRDAETLAAVRAYRERYGVE
jgi:orotate phosphoribosyltransferase